MKHILFVLFLSGMGATGSTSLAAQETAPIDPAPTAQMPPVNLTGLAKLSFRPDQDRYEDWENLRDSWEAEFLLTAREDGQPIRCEVIGEGISDELGTRLCRDLLLTSRVDIIDRISLGGRNGIVAVNKQPYNQLQGISVAGSAPASPFVFGLNNLSDTEYLDYAPLSPVEREGLENDPTRMLPVAAPPRYPRAAITQRLEGTTRMLLQVAMDGSLLSCRPFESAGSALLDTAACKYALRFIAFEPMEGVEAADAPFYHAIPMTWRLNR